MGVLNPTLGTTGQDDVCIELKLCPKYEKYVEEIISFFAYTDCTHFLIKPGFSPYTTCPFKPLQQTKQISVTFHTHVPNLI